MSARKQKYYVVWVGDRPGIYDSWQECQLQVKNYPGARFKSFDSKEEAVEAYRGNPAMQLGFMKELAKHIKDVPAAAARPHARDYSTIPGIRLDAVAVDGACAGNPGRMEYRAVRVGDGVEVFHRGADGSLVGTNNIAEYLGIIHLASYLAKTGHPDTPIYTDSRTALSWLRKRHSRTTLENTPKTAKVLQLLDRADKWLAENVITNPILKWNTEEWGEIPADFGRKA